MTRNNIATSILKKIVKKGGSVKILTVSIFILLALTFLLANLMLGACDDDADDQSDNDDPTPTPTPKPTPEPTPEPNDDDDTGDDDTTDDDDDTTDDDDDTTDDDDSTTETDVFTDDFEGHNIGFPPNEPWHLEGAIDFIEVYDQTKEKAAAGKAVKITVHHGGTFMYYSHTSPLFGTVGASFDMKATTGIADVFMDDSAIGATPQVRAKFDGAGNLVDRTGATCASVNMDQWYEVTILADESAKTYDVYLDGAITSCANVPFEDMASTEGLQLYGAMVEQETTDAVAHYDNARLFTVE